MNAAEELKVHTKDKALIFCAQLYTEPNWNEKRFHNLPRDYSPVDYAVFIAELNFTYDHGYGGQELFGLIWYADGSWSERGEYDGAEWWEHKTCPQIPPEL